MYLTTIQGKVQIEYDRPHVRTGTLFRFRLTPRTC